MRWPVLITLIALFLTASGSLLAETDLDVEKKFLNERYKDFFVHENSRKRAREQRLKGAKKHRLSRIRLAAERERIRKEFAKKRQEKPSTQDWDRLERAYEKKLVKRQQRREEKRKVFVKERQRLRSIREQAKKIPEVKEVGLE